MKLASWGKSSLLDLISTLTQRHAILLPPEALSEKSLLRVESAYRVQPPVVELNILDANDGLLAASLLTYEGHFPRRVEWARSGISYSGPLRMKLDVLTGAVTLGETLVGNVEVPLRARRFAFRLALRRKDGSLASRTTGHYLPAGGDEIGESYYYGDDYVDYEAQAAGEASQVLSLLGKHGASSPILEVGSATGLVLQKLRGAGYDVTGLDFSGWAVEKARVRLGDGAVFECNVETDDLPPSVAARGPFGTLLLWAVLEHFHEPFAVLAKLTQYIANDGCLVINTLNANSLSHHLFGADWEGYFDWTHHGADKISPDSMRRELPRIGWTIDTLHTHAFWHSGADPEHAVLRDEFANDGRFRDLLRSRGMGDFLVCVARKLQPVPTDSN